MKQPNLSIITCTRDSERYLPTCLGSVSKQKYLDYEHIFVDGHSSDSTLALIKNYQKKSPVNTILYQTPPKGISNAMNFAIKHSRGKYLYFLHSDDALIDSQVLAKVSRYLASNPSLDWVYGQVNVISGDNRPLGVFPRHLLLLQGYRWLLKFFNYVPHQAVFIKREIFAKHGLFNEKLKTVMDYEYYLRIMGKTNFHFIPLLVALYRVHANSQSSSRDNLNFTLNEQWAMKRRYQNPLTWYLSKSIDLISTHFNKTLQ